MVETAMQKGHRQCHGPCTEHRMQPFSCQSCPPGLGWLDWNTTGSKPPTVVVSEHADHRSVDVLVPRQRDLSRMLGHQLMICRQSHDCVTAASGLAEACCFGNFSLLRLQ